MEKTKQHWLLSKKKKSIIWVVRYDDKESVKAEIVEKL